MLPLKQVGDLIFKNQLTEELGAHTDCPIKKAESKPDLKEYFCSYESISISPSVNFRIGYNHFNSPLPASPATDIHTPPPNFG